MARLLLVHHTPYHFEILVSLWAELRGGWEADIWSSALGRWGRAALLAGAGATLFDPSRHYDAVVVVTDEAPLDAIDPASPVLPPLGRLPRVRVSHRRRPDRRPGELFLFPGAGHYVVPVAMDVSPPAPDVSPAEPAPGRRFLVQGNVEPRRGYGLLADLADALPQAIFNVVGQKVADVVAPRANIVQHLDLDEAGFEAACRANDFILPLIDPRRFSGYFSDRFSTSVLRGYSAGLPFIAHGDLFALYPLVGLAYHDDADLVARLRDAAAMSVDDLAAMRRRLALTRDDIRAANRAALAAVLAEVL